SPFAGDDYMSEEEMDIDEIEKMYKESDVNLDDDVNITSQLIKKAARINWDNKRNTSPFFCFK
ncbi:MAG TPA: hypothetical protein PLO31_02330, partial [Dysgonamonadaceae bacterium]|nr:hypothetical protein [Dysgonamonadaceae bacterium]